MSWSQDFLEALEQPATEWRFRMVTRRHAGLPVNARIVAPTDGEGPTGLRLVRPPASLSSSMSVGSWVCTSSGFSLELQGSAAARQRLVAETVRGSLIELQASPRGSSAWERIGAGQLHDITGVGPTFAVVCRGLLGALRTRITTDIDELRLFAGAGNSDSLNANYTPGDGEIQVTNPTAFERESGLPGVVLITPSGGGTPFYLTWTGTATSPNRLTGVSTSGQYSTSAVSAASGSDVTGIALLEHAPADILVRILQGAGNDTTGTAFSVPSTWAYQLGTLVDVADMKVWANKALWTTTGSATWSVLVSEAVDDATSWLQALLSNAGAWLTMRQGRLVLRAVQNPRAPDIRRTFELTERDVEAVVAWHAMHPSVVAGPYARVSVSSPGGTTTQANTVYALPMSERRTYSLSACYTNEALHRQAVLNRLGWWDEHVPEQLVVRTSGMRAAQLCEGDIIRVTLPNHQIAGAAEITGPGDFYTRRPALVEAVNAQWGSNRVQLTLAAAGRRSV